MSEAECRRLHSATRRAQRAVRIPRNGVGCRIEVVVAAMIDRKAERTPRGFETGEKAPLGGVAGQVCLGQAVIGLSSLRKDDGHTHRSRAWMLLARSCGTVETVDCAWRATQRRCWTNDCT